MSNTLDYSLLDFQYIAAGAAILASGGGGSYSDAVSILQALAQSGWSGTVPVQAYDGQTNACVLALMGSPDAAEKLTLADVAQSVTNTLLMFEAASGQTVVCLIPVEIGPINSIVPLIAASLNSTNVQWVVDGDGAGRAVPELPQTTYAGSPALLPCPATLANNADTTAQFQSTTLIASTASQIETLAGGVLSAFGSVSGIALWPSNAGNGYALSSHYIPNTLAQARALGAYLLTASTPNSTAAVATQITQLMGRTATPILTNFYITSVSQSTTSASLDTGIIRLDNTPDPNQSTETHYLYNLNENLIMYSDQSQTPDIVAPDSICYYSESTGLGFSNATDDLAHYYDFGAKQSTGLTVSIIKINAAPALYMTPGVLASFATVLRNIGYAGALPYTD